MEYENYKRYRKLRLKVHLSNKEMVDFYNLSNEIVRLRQNDRKSLVLLQARFNSDRTI